MTLFPVKITVTHVFLFMMLIFVVNLGYLDRERQLTCLASANRAQFDGEYNQELLSAEKLYASTIVSNDANAANRLRAHEMRIDAYQRRAAQSKQLQICINHAFILPL